MNFYYYSDKYYVVPSSGKSTYTFSYGKGSFGAGRYGYDRPFIDRGEKVKTVPKEMMYKMVYIIFTYQTNQLAFMAIQGALG